jgi:hypothetical protein
MVDSYKLNPSLGAVAPTPKPQSGIFVYGVKLIPNFGSIPGSKNTRNRSERNHILGNIQHSMESTIISLLQKMDPKAVGKHNNIDEVRGALIPWRDLLSLMLKFVT